MPARTPEETHVLLAAAFDAGDLDAFMDVFDEDAVLAVTSAETPVSGRAEIRDAMKEIFALEPTATIEVLDKLEANGLALTLARWALEGTDPAGQRVHLTGQGAVVSRRLPDGSWRILLDHPVRPE